MPISKKLQLIVMVSVFMLQYFAEHLFPQTKQNNKRPNEWKNLQWGLLGWAVNFVPAIGLAKWIQWVDTERLGLMNQFRFDLVIQSVIFLILMDLWMYWWHRMNHTVSFLWRFHQLHHTEEHMNTTTVLRFHFAELLISNLLKALVFLLLGPSISMVILYELLFFANVLFHHSNIRILPAADRAYRLLFSSPLMHRLHHSTKKWERNTNYGSVFSWWDRIFGSFKANGLPFIVTGLDEKNATNLSETKHTI
ncbi:MAG: sterol desaturase family protein [Bacteroidota bacterium]